jgi:putative sigma-54 modulation protein
MQVSITGHHVEVTDSLKAHVEEKISKLKRHFDNVQISGAKLFAEDVQEDMYVAIDNMVDKLDRQIVKHKEKTQDHHRG